LRETGRQTGRFLIFSWTRRARKFGYKNGLQRKDHELRIRRDEPAVVEDPDASFHAPAVSYVYDPVGNRTQKTSTLPGYPGGLSSYNPNDQLTTDTYDANGNTTLSLGLVHPSFLGLLLCGNLTGSGIVSFASGQ
jgi:hypothetical protein